MIKRKSRRIKKIDFEKLFDSSSRRKDGGRRERMHIQVGWCVGGHTWMDRVQSNTLVNMWAVTRKLSTREPCPWDSRRRLKKKKEKKKERKRKRKRRKKEKKMERKRKNAKHRCSAGHIRYARFKCARSIISQDIRSLDWRRVEHSLRYYFPRL